MDGVLLGARFELSDIPWHIEILKPLVESLQKGVVPEETWRKKPPATFHEIFDVEERDSQNWMEKHTTHVIAKPSCKTGTTSFLGSFQIAKSSSHQNFGV